MDETEAERLRAWMRGWVEVNQRIDAERRPTDAAERLRELASLMAFAKELGLDDALEAENLAGIERRAALIAKFHERTQPPL